jgi:hypothetical protein
LQDEGEGAKRQQFSVKATPDIHIGVVSVKLWKWKKRYMVEGGTTEERQRD